MIHEGLISLQQFQQLEERRGDFLKDIFVKYLFTQEALISGLQQSTLTLKQKVEGIDPATDLQEFIQEKRTGLQPAPLVEYEPYTGHVTHPG